MTWNYLNISRRESKLDEIMKDIETCKTNYLLGGQFWYPFQSLEVNKERVDHLSVRYFIDDLLYQSSSHKMLFIMVYPWLSK